MVQISSLANDVSQDIRDLIDQRSQEMISGSFDPFTGPINDQDGNEIIAAGVTPPDFMMMAEPSRHEFFVEGVVGSAEGVTHPAVELDGIWKRFPGVVANAGAEFLTVRPGTVHAVLGENGAGKTTLMNCLASVYRRMKAISDSTVRRCGFRRHRMPLLRALGWCTRSSASYLRSRSPRTSCWVQPRLSSTRRRSSRRSVRWPTGSGSKRTGPSGMAATFDGRAAASKS